MNGNKSQLIPSLNWKTFHPFLKSSSVSTLSTPAHMNLPQFCAFPSFPSASSTPSSPSSPSSSSVSSSGFQRRYCFSKRQVIIIKTQVIQTFNPAGLIRMTILRLKTINEMHISRSKPKSTKPGLQFQELTIKLWRKMQ